MNIAIVSNFSKSIFSNGLTQNLLYLHGVLDKSGFNVFFIDLSRETKSKKIEKTNKTFLKNKQVIPMRNLNKRHKCDIILNPSMAIIESEKDFILSKIQCKPKYVTIKYGNNTISRMQRWFLNKAESTALHEPIKSEPFYDAALLSPHFYYAHQAEGIINECNIKTIPYLWSPEIFIKQSKLYGIDDLYYKKTKSRQIVVPEPNLEIAKNFYIPILSLIHLLRTNPNHFDEATITNSMNIIQEKGIKNFILYNLGLNKFPKKIFFDERHVLCSTLNKYNPLILTHQLFCELNYVFLESLHFGYPLVHNSKMIENHGYFYKDFQCIDAAEKIKEAFESHNDKLQEYIDSSQEETWKYNPDNPEVQRSYESLMNDLIK
tara:strand:- start:2402 stop:3529 length:1128 start_codon:yes stop_codon:yes gene_type:complete